MTAPPYRKRPFDIETYPIDFSKRLPSGTLVGTAPATAVDQAGASAAVVAATSIRAGGQIVDVVLTGGAKGQAYTVSLQAVGDGAPSPTRWQKDVQFTLWVI